MTPKQNAKFSKPEQYSFPVIWDKLSKGCLRNQANVDFKVQIPWDHLHGSWELILENWTDRTCSLWFSDRQKSPDEHSKSFWEADRDKSQLLHQKVNYVNWISTRISSRITTPIDQHVNCLYPQAQVQGNQQLFLEIWDFCLIVTLESSL